MLRPLAPSLMLIPICTLHSPGIISRWSRVEIFAPRQGTIIVMWNSQNVLQHLSRKCVNRNIGAGPLRSQSLWNTLSRGRCFPSKYYFYAIYTGPPLWSSGQSSWLQILRCGFDSRRYQIFREVVGLERGPLSLVSTIEEILRRKSSGSGLENRNYSRKGSTALTLRHPSIRKRCHLLRRQAAVARPVYFSRGLRPRSLFFCVLYIQA
jgi:hypothetical protein